jgi:hypothetical protein
MRRAETCRGRRIVCSCAGFSAAGVMAYARAETAGGRKAPRHEIAATQQFGRFRSEADIQRAAIKEQDL